LQLFRQSNVSVASPGNLEESWRELDGAASPPALRLVRDDACD